MSNVSVCPELIVYRFPYRSPGRDFILITVKVAFEKSSYLFTVHCRFCESFGTFNTNEFVRVFWQTEGPGADDAPFPTNLRTRPFICKWSREFIKRTVFRLVWPGVLSRKNDLWQDCVRSGVGPLADPRTWSSPIKFPRRESSGRPRTAEAAAGRNKSNRLIKSLKSPSEIL